MTHKIKLATMLLAGGMCAFVGLAFAQTSAKRSIPAAKPTIPAVKPTPAPNAATARPAGPAPRLYDFKGVPLEISLDDFRNLPHPDGTEGTKVFCTGEKYKSTIGTSSFDETILDTEIYDTAETKAGVIKCVWVQVTGDFFAGHTSGLSLANSGYAANTYSFSFVRDPKDGVMRLYRFEGTSNADVTATVILAITGKFGPPKIETDNVQNKIGNTFKQTTAIWSNPLSTLVVQDRYTKIDDMGITLTDNRLLAVIGQAKAADDATKKNPI